VKKRGQITVFIIIAIMLLMGVSVYIYLSEEKEVKEEYIIPLLKEAPEAAKPVFNYVQLCLRDTARSGLRAIGDHGGYIDISDFEVNPVNPTEGNAVMFTPGSDLIVPYWYHLSSKNNCEQRGQCDYSTERPPLSREQGSNSIEEQLDKFMNENIEYCFRDFRDFEHRGITVRILGEPDARTTITERGVAFFLKLSLEVIKAGATYEISEFFYEEPLPLKEMYDVATEILNVQINHSFLERHILNLMSMSQGMDKPLPPYAKTEFEMGIGKIWIKSEIKKTIRDNILPQVQLFRVANVGMTNWIDTSGNPFTDTIFNLNMVVPLKEPHPELGATFLYLPVWEPYFNLNCEGEICTSDSLNNFFIMLIGLQKYQFVYDLSFPVLLQIVYPSAFEYSGYNFKLFFEVNLRNNKPLKLYNFSLALADLSIPSQRTMLCDNEMRTSGEITVNVNSGVSHGPGANAPVDKASVGFYCGKEKCIMGNTQQGTLISKFPRCLNGVVEVFKDDYQSAAVDFSVVDDEDRTLDITLEPFRYVNVTVYKKPVIKSGQAFNYRPDLAGPLRANEEAIIVLTKQKDNQYEQAFTTFITAVGNDMSKDSPCPKDPLQPIPKTETRENIQILPGSYDAMVTVFSYEDIVIPKETREVGWPGEDFDMPEMVFGCEQAFPMGSTTFPVTIDKVELDLGNRLMLFAPVFDLQATPENQRKVEDLDGIDVAANIAATQPSTLQPVIRP